MYITGSIVEYTCYPNSIRIVFVSQNSLWPGVRSHSLIFEVVQFVPHVRKMNNITNGIILFGCIWWIEHTSKFLLCSQNIKLIYATPFSAHFSFRCDVSAAYMLDSRGSLVVPQFRILHLLFLLLTPNLHLWWLWPMHR